MVMELIMAQDTAILVIPASKKLWVTTRPAITPTTLTLTAMVTTDTEATVATDTDMVATDMDMVDTVTVTDTNTENKIPNSASIDLFYE